MHKTRSFIAVPIESPASDAVVKLLRNLSQERSVRWVNPQHLHLTVKFLGDVRDCDLPEACRCLQAAAAEIEPFFIHLEGIGTFPRDGIPRVVWLGIRTDSEALSTIHRRLDQSLESLGVRREGRAFRPHLTLGRTTANTDKQALEQRLKTIDPQPLAAMEVNHLQLIASFLDRTGPTYQVVDSVSLA